MVGRLRGMTAMVGGLLLVTACGGDDSGPGGIGDAVLTVTAEGDATKLAALNKQLAAQLS